MPTAAHRVAEPTDRSTGFGVYAVVVVVTAVAAVWWLNAGLPDVSRGAPGAFWVVAVLAVGVETRPFVVPGRSRSSRLSPSICFTFALLLGWGLTAAVVVQLLAVVVHAVRRRHQPWRVAFDASQYALAMSAAALVLRWAALPSMLTVAGISLADAIAVGASVLTWFVVNEALVAAGRALHTRGGFLRTLSASIVDDSLANLPLLSLSPLVVAAASVNATFVILMLIPLFSGNEMARYVEEEQLKAQRDELTGLPNRKALFTEISSRAHGYPRRPTRSARDPRRMALLLLDIDQFRQVNGALGHVAGDRLLVAVADRLAECVGVDGTVARLGGDEFAIFAHSLADSSAASQLAQRIGDALHEPVRVEGLPLEVTAAIGVAIYPEHGRDNPTLLRNAEIAMYDAKDRSASFVVYAPESDRNSADRLELLADLRRVLERAQHDEIQLHYQPQVHLASGEVVGAEALLRWQHPRRGLISPEFLIKIVEHTAVMRLLTQRVLEDGIAQLAKWRAQGLVLRVSINVSVRDLHHPEFVDRLAAMLADHDVPAGQLQLEITESALMADPRRVMVTLHRLETLGVALSLDDFGVGYSSLQHLRRLPLAEVKIDRSFVLGMVDDPDDTAVVRSIIDLARALGLRVVAEGVEEDATRRMLLDEGCEVGQGWFYARAMPADAFASWLSQYQPDHPDLPDHPEARSHPRG